MVALPTRRSLADKAVEIDEEFDYVDDTRPVDIDTPIDPSKSVLVTYAKGTPEPPPVRGKFAAAAAILVPAALIAVACLTSILSYTTGLILLGAVCLCHGLFAAAFRAANKQCRGWLGAVMAVVVNAATVALFSYGLPVAGAMAGVLAVYTILAYGIKEEPCTSTKA